MRPARFLDPLYGVIEFDERERALLFSPEFQRLRYVRLCNINSLYISGASEPSRFEHCVGVYYLAREWARLNELGQEEAFIFKSSGLLHDLQTGPFGHSFQYVLEDNDFDETFTHSDLQHGSEQNFHQRTERGATFAGRQFTVPALLAQHQAPVSEAIKGHGAFGPLISGTLDIDNLDNVVRLAFHVGLCTDEDRHLPVQLVRLLRTRAGVLETNSTGKRLIERWFQLRENLYTYLLLDRGEFSAKAMLTLAVEIAAKAQILWPDHWRLTDDELLAYIEEKSVGESQLAGRIIKRLRVGNLFDEIGVWTTSDLPLYEALRSSDQKRSFEAKIENFANTKWGERLKVCLHPIIDKSKTRRSVTIYNTSSGESELIGSDSADLHLGLFVTNEHSEGLPPRSIDRYREAFEQVIKDFSKSPLTPTADPLYPETQSVNQFSLI